MKVVLADDHPMILRGVRSTLEAEDDILIVAETSTGDETLQALLLHRPDLLVLDLSMPGLSPAEIIARGQQEIPHLKVLILSAHGDDHHLMKVAPFPISGYLIKDEAPEHLLQAIRVIAQGAVWFSQSLADRLRGLRKARERSENGEAGGLTGRERQVLELLGAGLDNQVIAARLNLAEQTVRNYASTLYAKIGVASRMEALVWAREHGFRWKDQEGGH